MVTSTPALAMSRPATRSQNSGSSSASFISISCDENAACHGRGRSQEPGANGKSGPRARSTNQRPSNRFPASDCRTGSDPP
jgi:hypothetical protein